MMNKLSLAQMQGTCKIIEEEMLAFLMQYSPCLDMTVGDVKTIAGFARNIAFKKFDEALTGAMKNVD